MQTDYRRLQARAAVANAVAAAIGTFFAILIGLVAAGYYVSSIDEARKKTAADALFEWRKSGPVNEGPCGELIAKLETDDWRNIISRNASSVPKLNREILNCLSDQTSKELSDFFDRDNSILTPRGAALIASRTNQMLGSDNFIAAFIMNDVGNQGMYDNIQHNICTRDAKIIAKLPQNIDRIKTDFVSLRKFIDTGCGGSK